MRRWRSILLMSFMSAGCSTETPRACSPPRPTWGRPRSFGLVVLNKIALDRVGRTYWNGEPVSRNTLDKHLAQGATLNPEPWIFLETEMGASCTAVNAIRDQIEKRVDCSTGYRCNEGIMTVWDRTPSPPGTPAS